MPFFETDGLLIKAGIPDDSGRNLGIIGFDDPNTIFREILIADVKGIAVNNSLDHRRIQEAKPFSRTGYLVSHALRSQSPTTPTKLDKTVLQYSVKQTRGNCQEFIGFQRAAAALLASSFDTGRLCVVVASACLRGFGCALECHRIACTHIRIHCQHHTDQLHSPVAATCGPLNVKGVASSDHQRSIPLSRQA